MRASGRLAAIFSRPDSSRVSPRATRIVAIWLLAGCALVAAIVVVGGVTRLTGSGLSIVDWEPLSGVVPPLSADSWEREFAAYREYPEYQLVNRGMTLSEFKRIFWVEYAHRLLGRLAGLAFIIPFGVFLWKGFIPRRLLPRLAAIFVLGGAQGFLGWWMVQSGLADTPRVSQYRLTAHLALAALTYGLTFWTALSVLRPGEDARSGETPEAPGRLRWRVGRWSAALTALAALTIVSGGFVAGLRAGLVHNTFPKMDGAWIPAGMFAADPWWRNLFENLTTVQFNHRVLAMLLLAGVTVICTVIVRAGPAAASIWARASMAAVWTQALLGVATLLAYVPVSLAVLHQVNAFVLLTGLLGLTHELRRTA